ncbi:cytochrome P450 monooxygenase-like protein [Lophium mytilinum]|uniref:Cytochrome P450 monooxygenase-like protein n=1 Tax=Lophium mytilinum TaxID=390894 RepID=A0A6A6QRT8_9PEZI|nr:cytochrome P450 monooxygenase-like protein [Lophium mytilinum]
MATSLLISLFLIPCTFLAWNIYTFSINYSRARKIGLPIIIRPFDQLNPLWILVGRFLLPIFERVPFGSGNFTRFCRHGFEIRDTYHWVDEFGDAFVTVSPAKIWLCIADPDTISEIIARSRKEFDRPMETMEMLNVLGKNVSSVQGAEWQRQRKIVNIPFNEQNNRIVFDEALRQGAGMIKYWTSRPGNVMDDVLEDSKTFTLNVLSGAGFGRSAPFAGFDEQQRSTDSGFARKNRENLSTILDYILLILVVGPRLLTAPFMPKAVSRIGQAVSDFKEYVSNIVSEEKSLIRQGKSSASSLVASLIRASEQASDKEGAKAALSESEIFGNIFIFHFAGYDTTALSLSTAFVFLAACPDVQDWISDEIRCVLPNDDQSTWNYAEAFPRFKRCVAVLYETLRLYNPTLGFLRMSMLSTPTTLTINNQPYTLPPKTIFNVNSMALATHPRYWGADSLAWNPKRWTTATNTTSSSSASTTTATINAETLLAPPKATFLPWADGPRVCPGKKFAQVEFVGLMCALFRDHRVEPVLKAGESMSEARERTLAVARDQEMYLLMEMRRPGDAKLKWLRR